MSVLKKTLLLLIFSIGSLTPVLLFIFHFGYVPTNTLNDWGAFGSFASGVYGTLAFFAVAYSLFLTKNQFTKQNEDIIFYKAIDGLDKHVQVVESENSSLVNLSELMKEATTNQCASLVRRTICNNIDLIANQYLIRIFQDGFDTLNTNKDIQNYFNEIIEKYSSKTDFSDKWESLKNDLGPEGFESESTARELTSIGSVIFYKVPFESRANIFEKAFREILNSYGLFIDRYKKTLHFSLDFAKKSINKDMYKKYIISKLTNHEIVLLYYISMIGKDKDLINLLNEFEIFRLLENKECLELIVDCPSYDKVNEDIGIILKNINSDEAFTKLVKRIMNFIRSLIKK